MQTHVLEDGCAPPADSDLVFVFDERQRLRAGDVEALRRAAPRAHVVGCSTAGTIAATSVRDDVVVAAVRFDRTRLRLAQVRTSTTADSERAGAALAESLRGPELVHVFVLSDGLGVNGTPLVRGLVAGLPAGVSISGGLAADPAFARTTVIADGAPEVGVIAAVGFYGSSLRVGCGSLGGWDPFGPERRITRSDGNILYELDHRPALTLYRQYLGDDAAALPGSGLRFPLAMRAPGSPDPVVRTILGLDEAAGSITFAGDMPEGHLARLMKANFDRLVDGAQGAARDGLGRLGSDAELALLVSCAGRRLVLQQRTEDELEAVRQVVGAAPMIGFYSLGELGPSGGSTCELHNQTMTITTMAER